MTRGSPQERAARGETAPPRHVAIIMDGNGRWAAERGLSRLEGHEAGTRNLRTVVQAMYIAGVEFLTLFAFSTENWRRPNGEVEGLFALLRSVIGQETEELHRRNVRIRHMGARRQLPPDVADAIEDAVALTAGNTGLELCVALNYGGRAEIVEAVRRIVAAGAVPEDVTEELVRANLCLPDVPDPDLVIRTAGEQRLSNFLIWQAAYSEYYQTSAYWPDFDGAEVEQALAEYRRRSRRFGALPKET